MSGNLIPFLESLVEDPDALEAFRQDAETAVQDAGLSEEEQEIILSRDPKRIRDAVLDETRNSLPDGVDLPDVICCTSFLYV